MKKIAHAHSALVHNRQFHSRITCKKYGHFDEGVRKKYNMHLGVDAFFISRDLQNSALVSFCKLRAE